MISNISNEEALNILKEDIKFKLFIAKSYLQEIKPNIPPDYNYEYLVMESNIESFLFFGIGALDASWQEINRKLKLGIKDHAICLRKIKKELGKKIDDNKSNLILTEINKNFTDPIREDHVRSEEDLHSILKDAHRFPNVVRKDDGKKYEIIWDRSKSGLWEITTLRNYIAHHRTLRRTQIIEAHTESGYKATAFLNVPLVKLSDYTLKDEETDRIENPHEYFSKSLIMIEEFIEFIKNTLNS